MAGSVIECKLCRRDINSSRWLQHLNSKRHIEIAEETQRELEDIEHMTVEEGVLDDDSSDDDTDSEDLSE